MFDALCSPDCGQLLGASVSEQAVNLLEMTLPVKPSWKPELLKASDEQSVNVSCNVRYWTDTGLVFCASSSDLPYKSSPGSELPAPTSSCLLNTSSLLVSPFQPPPLILDYVFPRLICPHFSESWLLWIYVPCVPASSSCSTWSFLKDQTISLQTKQKSPHCPPMRLLLLISQKQGGQMVFTSWSQLIEL